MRYSRLPTSAAAVVPLALTGCQASQSALAPNGAEAESIFQLSVVLTAGAVAILAGVTILAALAVFGGEPTRRWLAREGTIVGLGIVLPIVTLSVLLTYGLLLMRGTGGDGEPYRIHVTGEQWWWRVAYLDEKLGRVETANEIRIPTGRKIELSLTTADVIHSFWVPNLAGKVDMIPGRTNRLTLSAERPGTSRGQCAEYCGGAHALMSLHVVALDPAEFENWLQKEAKPADVAADDRTRTGGDLFRQNGCGGCHSIRGSEAAGTIGPDLTHVGGRLSLGAGVLANSESDFGRWIADGHSIKPENRMPSYGIFAPAELAALSAYLAGLK